MAEPVLSEHEIGLLRGELLGLVVQARGIDKAAVSRWHTLLQRQDAIGCYTNPSGWNATQKERTDSIEMLKAFLRFRSEIDRLFPAGEAG